MNTIMIIIDTLRRDHLGCYGNGWIQTPNLDAFASRSVIFDNAYLASSPCMPARREIMTGRYEFPFRGWGPLEPWDHDLPGALQKAGKGTALVTDHYHLFEHGSGNYHFHYDSWDFIRGQENDHWIADPSIPPRFPAPEKTKCHFRWAQYMRNTARWRDAVGKWKDERHTFTAQTFAAAADWLGNHHALRDPGFFLTIDHFDPHEPFDPPAPYDTLYTKGEVPAERVRWPIYGKADRYTPQELADIRALYAGKVTLVDRWFKHFMERVEALGLMDDTMIVVTTDHGHLFGEHGMIGKPGSGHGDSTLYQEMAHIPLLVYHPDFRSQAGSRRACLAQPVDYFPTVLDAMGAARPDHEIHGTSLMDTLGSAEARTREFACFGKYGEGIHVTDGAWTLSKWPPAASNGPLYWYSADPPRFIVPKGLGPFEHDQMRFSVDHVRGPARDALWNVSADPKQEKNVLADEPKQAARLAQGLRAFLKQVGAPAEQETRLGLCVAQA